MKKILLTACVTLGLASLSANADALKNSLMPTTSNAEKPMVNLDNLNVGARPGPVATPRKSRSGKAVIGTVDGHKIYKQRADEFLKMATKGKISDFDRLPKKQRAEIVNNLASATLIEERAKKEVTKDEKDKLAAQYWVSKKMKKVTVSDDEAKKFYEANKKAFKSKDGKQLSYEKVEKYVKMTVKQQKFTKDIMKKAKIVIK